MFSAGLNFLSTVQEADLKTQQHLQSLEASIAELTASNMEMCSRERLMTELVQTQENFIDRLASHEVKHTSRCPLGCCPVVHTLSYLTVILSAELSGPSNALQRHTLHLARRQSYI